MTRPLPNERWVLCLGGDPRPWLLAQAEPAARWIALTALLDYDEGHQAVREAQAAVVADPGTAAIVERLPAWASDARVSGHNSPGYAPNLLHLLADMGVGPGDFRRVDSLLGEMLEHQDGEGRFLFFARAGHGAKGRPAEAAWGALACDHHAIGEVLVRFGRAEDPRVRQSLARMADDLTATAQGPSWLCRPGASGFRGPGRKADFCPQVALEALRTFSRLPDRQRPPGLLEAARTSAGAWARRHQERPYMFGHGRRFLTAKWPAFWYDAGWFLDTLGRYPELWEDPSAHLGARRILAEVAAGLILAGFGPDGLVTPKSCYQGFAGYSFGQKRQPSAFATARLCAILRRLEALAGDIGELVGRAGGKPALPGPTP